MLINLGIWLKVLQWNSLYCNESIEQKLPYLTYKIKIRCKNLNLVKLSKKQLNLYNQICELKNEGLTYKQISNKLNKLGYEPTRGKVGEFTPQKVWSNYTKIKKNQDKKVEVTSVEIDKVELMWE